jgi:HEPN domain-containing protein
VLPGLACFHAQQAAEKALKGLLVLAGVDVPRSHELDAIARSLPGQLAERFDQQALVELSPWATKGRYPATDDDPSPERARSFLEVAQSVVDQATAHLANRPRS